MQNREGLKIGKSDRDPRRGGGVGVSAGSGVERKPLSLYVHIPFCVRKCDYCDFLSAPASEEVREDYVNLLCEEIEEEAALYPGYLGRTVFFGGGTPTVLKPEQLERILCKLKECFSVFATGTQEAEITLECNPGTVDGGDLGRLREAGFNRLSIGAQSMQNEELLKLGRIHTREDFLKTFHLARKAGFRNINIDLMSALPGQSTESYVNSLREAASLHPEHISAYSLIIEEGTPFFERYGEADKRRRRDGEDGDHLLPSEEEERRMYELTQEILGQSGYRRYEISNYALPGCECRHNITYWTRGDYLGLGLGAASLMDNCRFTKSRDLKEYRRLLRGCGKPEYEMRPGNREGLKGKDGGKDKEKLRGRDNRKDQAVSGNRGESLDQKNFHQEFQRLSKREQMEEFMFLGLRLMRGVSCQDFRDCFHVPIEQIYGEVIKRLESQKLLVRSGDGIRLTRQGVDVSNVVFAEFLL